jgi:hypothetical protein
MQMRYWIAVSEGTLLRMHAERHNSIRWHVQARSLPTWVDLFVIALEGDFPEQSLLLLEAL